MCQVFAVQEPLGLAELTETPSRSMHLPAFEGDDADRAVGLQDRLAHLRQIGDTVLARRHRDVLFVDVLVRHVLLEEGAVLHQQRGLVAEEMRDVRDLLTEARQKEIHANERRGRDQPDRE